MVKMVVSICLLAAGLYLSWSVKLGDLTFREHMARILETDEAKELGDGIVATVASAKTAAKTKLSERLEKTKDAVDESAEDDEDEREEDEVRLGDITKPLPQR